MTIKEKEIVRHNLTRLIKDRQSKLTRNKRKNKEIEEELANLKEIYNIVLKSEFQIVMYRIDTSNKEEETTYIIYDVEENKVYEIKKQGINREIVPDGIEDYSELFADIGDRYNIWKSYPLEEHIYNNIITLSVIMFKKIIEEIQNKYDCNTWEELKTALGHEIFMRDANKFHMLNSNTNLRINPFK